MSSVRTWERSSVAYVTLVACFRSLASNVDAIHPGDRATNRVLTELGIADRLVVQFMGNMGRTHGLETLVEAAELLRGNESVRFLLIGWGKRRPWVEQRIAEGHLPDVTLLPSCGPEELDEHLNACDIACIPFLKGMAGVSVPSRLYNVLAAGRPVLAVADASSEVAMVVREEGIGWVVEPEDAEALVAAIEEVVGQRDQLAAMGAKARRVAEEKYSYDAALRRYEALFEAVLGPA